jgi:hypothetical protein
MSGIIIEEATSFSFLSLPSLMGLAMAKVLRPRSATQVFTPVNVPVRLYMG